MENLWNKEFKPALINTPKEIIEAQCDYLKQKTDGNILAKVSDYIGPISSYTKVNIFQVLGNNFSNREVDIQEDLGDIGESTFTYDFYITSPFTPNYKYRVMFLQHLITIFPTLIVLDEAIAEELSGNQDVICNSQEDFENKLKHILNSKKLESIINALLAISQKEKTAF